MESDYYELLQISRTRPPSKSTRPIAHWPCAIIPTGIRTGRRRGDGGYQRGVHGAQRSVRRRDYDRERAPLPAMRRAHSPSCA